jgi:type II secretory pathway predicted ATPase ExeA
VFLTSKPYGVNNPDRRNFYNLPICMFLRIIPSGTQLAFFEVAIAGVGALAAIPPQYRMHAPTRTEPTGSEIHGIQMAWSLIEPPAKTAQRFPERVYADFFSLRGVPFSITPDPRFLFLADTHQGVLEKITYGIQGRMGFMLLTGEVGTGKTTMCRVLLDRLENSARTVYVINPSLSGLELIACILEDLGIEGPAPGSRKEALDRLYHFLLSAPNGSPVVIIVDDAQTMPQETLEDLRLLSNLETDEKKLLQMLLVGQPELLALLDRPELRQLKQRVAVHCRLDFLARNEVAGYIERRLAVAGNQGQVRFDPKAVRRIFKISSGIPRMVNKVCDLALTAAYTDDSHIVDARHVAVASEELVVATLQGSPTRKPSPRRVTGPRVVIAAAGLALLIMTLGFYAGTRPQRFSDQPQSARAMIPALPAPAKTAAAAQDLLQETPDVPRIEISPYILQLGSYNTVDSTLRAIAIYARKGIHANWSAIDLGEKGLWYRVFTGRYASRREALQYQQAHQLTEARILHAPWVVELGVEKAAGPIEALIQNDQLDTYTLSGTDGRRYLFCGAFVSRAGAETLVESIYRQTGVTVEATLLGEGSALPDRHLPALSMLEPP